MRRRDALRAGGVAVLAATAGCFDVPFERPRALDVQNTTDRAWTVDVVAGANGETLVDRTVTVEADEAERFDVEFPGPGLFYATEYTLAADVEDGGAGRDSRSVTGRDGFDALVVSIRDEGTVELGFEDAA